MFPTTQSIPIVLKKPPNPTTTTPQKQQQQPISTSNTQFDRTFTLPTRFRKKFSVLNLSGGGGSSTSPPKQQQLSNCELSSTKCVGQQQQQPLDQLALLTKFVDNLLKSLKYLEVIVSKQKLEIVASNTTAVLESVLDVYNQLKTSPLVDDLVVFRDLEAYKARVNLSLANLIKWSDEVFLAEASGDDKAKETLCATSTQLIAHLTQSINSLVNFCTEVYESTNQN